MFSLRNFCVVIILMMGLAGCAASQPQGGPLPSFNFQYMEKFPVNVAQVEVVNHYADHKHTADIGDQFVAPPSETLSQYLRSRYAPQSQRGNLVFEIEEASAFIFHEEASNRAGKWLHVAGYEEYSLTMKVNVRALDIPGFNERSKLLTARHRLKISEHASVAERESKQFEALEKMLHDLDYTIERVLRDEFRVAN